MLIVCPSCASEYALDPARIGPAGRRVRCASCRESWSVAGTDIPAPPPAEDSAFARERAFIDQPSEPLTPTLVDAREGSLVETLATPLRAERAIVVIEADAPAPTLPNPVRDSGLRRKRARRRVAIGLRRRPLARRIVLAASLFAAVALPAAVVARAPLVRIVPQSAVLFEAAGLPVNLVGLDLGRISSALGHANGKPELTVEGQITNPGSRALGVPPVEIAIQAADGSLLYSWAVASEDARVAAGATTRFRARLASPPPAGQSVAVTFRARLDGEVVALR